MKLLGLAVLSALALVGVFALGLFGLAHFENPSTSFQTYKELEESGFIERGWVPTHLPTSATEIEESHDIDSNEGWMSFRYRPGDTAKADEGCRLLHQTSEGKKYLCPPFGTETTILILRIDGRGFVSLHADEI
jgi:hypothetical protein